ncbi:MAG: hypothetical protein RI911_838 [Candidatus Parcubacteria bacterium]|jgi:hypothetical protein
MTQDAPKKLDAHATPVEFITEREPVNPLSDVTRTYDLPTVRDEADRDAIPLRGFSHLSSEGFAGNEAGQAQIAHFLAEKLHLKERGPVIDVGFGANVFVSKAFADLGIESHALDAYTANKNHTYDRSMFDVPATSEGVNEHGVYVYTGDVTALQSEGSVLKGKKFGCVLFNGSWVSGQNNFSVVGEMMEFKDHDLQQGRITRSGSNSTFYDGEKDRAVTSCVASLAPHGLVGVVSSRYAFHGGGYSFDQLPYEKLQFMDLYDRLKRQGAKKFYAFGITPAGLSTQVSLSIAEHESRGERVLHESEDHISVGMVERALTDQDAMPQEPEYYQGRARGEEERERALFEDMRMRTKDAPLFQQLARIDALFAEF